MLLQCYLTVLKTKHWTSLSVVSSISSTISDRRSIFLEYLTLTSKHAALTSKIKTNSENTQSMTIIHVSLWILPFWILNIEYVCNQRRITLITYSIYAFKREFQMHQNIYLATGFLVPPSF